MYKVYIIRNAQGKYYIGQTNNLERRLYDHNRGKDHATKSGTSWRLIHKESYVSRSEATRRERYLKSLKSRSALRRIIAG